MKPGSTRPLPEPRPGPDKSVVALDGWPCGPRLCTKVVERRVRQGKNRSKVYVLQMSMTRFACPFGAALTYVSRKRLAKPALNAASPSTGAFVQILGNPLRAYRRRQWRQAMGCACGITVRISHAVLPTGIELSTSTRTLRIEGAAHRAANIAEQTDTACRLAASTLHGNVNGTDLFDQLIGDAATGRLALTPVKRHTEIRAAGATAQARAIGHDGGLR